MRLEVEGLDDLEAALERIDADVGAEMGRALLAGGAVIGEDAAWLAGEPASSFAAEMTGQTATEAQVSIGPVKGKWYLKYREFGTRPHEIKPKSKRALRLADGTMRARVIRHPGVMARPFLRPAFDTKREAAVEAVRAYLDRVIEGSR